MFEIENVKFKNILNIPYFKFREHEMNIIVGESGSGKTTLFKLLNKLYTHDVGTIKYKNTDITTLDSIAHRRNVVFISQNPTLTGTLRDSVNEAFWFQDIENPSEKEILKYMDFFKLEKSMLDKETVRFSAGEKQRVALLRGVMLNSETLLLDEPFANLNYQLSYEIMNYFNNELIDVHKKNIVMISHFNELNEKYAKNVANMKHKNISWE